MFKEMESLSNSEKSTISINVKKIHQFKQEILMNLPDVSKLSLQFTTRISKYIKDVIIQIDFGV